MVQEIIKLLLKMYSEYPYTIEQANLLTIPDMLQRFKVKVGVSDHTIGKLFLWLQSD